MSEKSVSYRFKSISSFILGALLLVNPVTGLASLETSKPEAQGVSSEKLQRLSELSQKYVDEAASLESLILSFVMEKSFTTKQQVIEGQTIPRQCRWMTCFVSIR